MVSEPTPALFAQDQRPPNLAEHQNHWESLKNDRSWTPSRDTAAAAWVESAVDSEPPPSSPSGWECRWQGALSCQPSFGNALAGESSLAHNHIPSPGLMHLITGQCGDTKARPLTPAQNNSEGHSSFRTAQSPLRRDGDHVFFLCSILLLASPFHRYGSQRHFLINSLNLKLHLRHGFLDTPACDRTWSLYFNTPHPHPHHHEVTCGLCLL